MFLGLQQHYRQAPARSPSTDVRNSWCVSDFWPATSATLFPANLLRSVELGVSAAGVLRTGYSDYIAVIYLQHVCLYMRARPPRPPRH